MLIPRGRVYSMKLLLLRQVLTQTVQKILRWFIANEKDAAKQKQYFEELMKVHDQRIKYLDILNSYVKTPVTKGSIIGMKAHDYFTMGCPDLNTAYNLFKEAVELEKKITPITLYFKNLPMFPDVRLRLMKHTKNSSFKTISLLPVMQTQHSKKETKAKTKELLKVAKDNIDAFFH